MQTPAAAAPSYHPAWNSLSTILWIASIGILLVYFRREIDALAAVMLRRLRQGSGLKFGAFELGSVYIAPGSDALDKGATQSSRKDDGTRHKQRESYYLPNRNLMLVHRISPSNKPGQLYDVLVYLVPHPTTDATLLSVKAVEYYFGKSWGRGIFTSIDRARGFPVSTSAYGPFMCTAEIQFVDGKNVFVSRYVDFEMGAQGAGSLPPTGKER